MGRLAERSARKRFRRVRPAHADLHTGDRRRHRHRSRDQHGIQSVERRVRRREFRDQPADDSGGSAPLTSSNAQTCANNLANIVASSYSTGWANATVVVNNSLTASITNGGAISTTGTSTNANSFYCPTGSVKVGITWGSSYTSAGTSCSTGGPVSGQYIVLSATKSFTALILPASIMSNSFTVSAVVQVQ